MSRHEGTPSGLGLTQFAASNDPYLLRHLGWCAPCDIRLVPGYRNNDTDRIRVYNCPLSKHQLTLVAEDLEAAVMGLASQMVPIDRVSAEFRQSALELLLVMVRFGAEAGDVSQHWRSSRPPPAASSRDEAAGGQEAPRVSASPVAEARGPIPG